MARYDFRCDEHFRCRRPWRLDAPVAAVARAGAAADYAQRYARLQDDGVTLIHSPAEYERCSLLPHWYPLIEELTPRSLWFESPPPVETVAETFGFPVFIKGERQTSRHQAMLSVVRSREQYAQILAAWQADSILSRQRMVVREFVPLRGVAEGAPASGSPYHMPASFEFRTFWWRGECVGFGRYWLAHAYAATPDERTAAVTVARRAAEAVGVPFLIVDLAQAEDGRWLVIECNDGQDCGYAGVAPLAMWRRIVDIESARPPT